MCFCDCSRQLRSDLHSPNPYQAHVMGAPGLHYSCTLSAVRTPTRSRGCRRVSTLHQHAHTQHEQLPPPNTGLRSPTASDIWRLRKQEHVHTTGIICLHFRPWRQSTRPGPLPGPQHIITLTFFKLHPVGCTAAQHARSAQRAHKRRRSAATTSVAAWPPASLLPPTPSPGSNGGGR